MAALDDILQGYRAPRVVVRGLLARARSEPRALSLLIAALIVIFVGQWPRLARDAELGDLPLTGLVLGTALALGAMIPVFYALAAVAVVLTRLFGGRGDWYGGRIALFWALLAVSPLMLLQGLVAGFIGPGGQLSLVSGLVFVVFLIFWGAGLRVAAFEGR